MHTPQTARGSPAFGVPHSAGPSRGCRSRGLGRTHSTPPRPLLHPQLTRKLFDGSRGSRQSPARTSSSKPRNLSSPDAAVQGLSGVKAWSGAGPSRRPFCCPARRLCPRTSPLRAEVTLVVPGSRAAGLRSGGNGLRRSLQAQKEPRMHLVRFRGVTALSPGPPTAVARGRVPAGPGLTRAPTPRAASH